MSTRGLLSNLLMLAALIVSGCQRETQPSGLFAGTWAGTVSDGVKGRGTMRLVLTQAGLALRGTVQTTFGGAIDRDGPVLGTALGGGTSASLSHTAGRSQSCANGLAVSDTITMTISAAGGRMTGSYLGFGCDSLIGGTFDLGPSP